MKVYTSSDISAATLSDSHRVKFAPKSQWLSTPEKYGATTERKLPWAEITCPSCLQDVADPRHGFFTDSSKVPLTLAESDWLLGRSTKQKQTLSSLMDRLAELAADDQ
jgi:hypothetical protein